MNWKLEEMTEFVNARLSAKRFEHVKGVIKTAKDLAKRHGVNVADAQIAALLHDVSKEQDLEQTKRILQLKNEHAYLAHSSKIWHAPLGAIVAAQTFGISNPDILNAIRFHTTGRLGMSELEKVIFVADYTEPNRTYSGCIEVRKLWHDLTRATCEILKQKVEKVNANGGEVHPDTIAAYEYYKNLIAG